MTIMSNEMRGFNINFNSVMNEDNCNAISDTFDVLLGEVILNVLCCELDGFWVKFGKEEVSNVYICSITLCFIRKVSCLICNFAVTYIWI